MSALVKIDFHGDTLFAEQDADGVVVVAIKPIIERLGLDWVGQLQRLKRDEVLSSSMCMIHMETPAGMRETVGLPLNLIPGFLFGIETSRISDPDVKAAVLAYQRECHEVLFRHFYGARDLAIEPVDDDLHAVNTKLRMVETAMKINGRAAARALWDEIGLPPMRSHAEMIRPQQGAMQAIGYVQQFLSDDTVEDARGVVQARVLAQRYTTWARKNEAPAMTERALAICLDALGIQKSRGRVHTYLGIRLKHISELMG